MKPLNKLALVAILFVGVTQSASAGLVQWTLNGWDLVSGDDVTGSFDYDADSNAFSNVSIFSGGASFTFVGSFANESILEFFTGDPGGDLFDKLVVTAQIGGGGMTNAGGGPLSVLTQGGTNSLSSVALCVDSACDDVGDIDFLTSGNITGVVSAVPVPAAVWLFGTALVGLFGFGKRKKAT